MKATTLFVSPIARAGEANSRTSDVSLYGLATGMTSQLRTATKERSVARRRLMPVITCLALGSALAGQGLAQTPTPNSTARICPCRTRPVPRRSSMTRRIRIQRIRPSNNCARRKGAPNVLIVLIDDAGFGSSSAFGGPCQTPTLEKLAAGGLKYNRFHTTAICSPTRQALLTGRNHHSVGMAGITEIATGAPGYSSVRPNSMAPLAMTLKLNGYATAQFGKNHEVPVWETSPVGPFDAWPTGGGGFEYFYGFLGGEANQWYPTLFEGTTPVENKKTPEQGYHLMTDMTDKTIKWIAQQKMLAPDKPFFIYFAPGATHAPHHVAKEWADKYKGKFDQGWDKVREETFARQKKLGVIPADCQLTARPKEIPAWDAMPEAFKAVLRREMEVYAGFMEFTDYNVGRIVDVLEKLNILDDTLIYYIVGDNGASAEGGINGCFNEMSYFNGLQDLETAEYLTARIDKLGGPESYNHYAVGWAHAMNTPLPVDQAGRLPLGRHAQRHRRPLAQGHQSQGRDSLAVHPRALTWPRPSSRRPACRSRFR